MPTMPICARASASCCSTSQPSPAAACSAARRRVWRRRASSRTWWSRRSMLSCSPAARASASRRPSACRRGCASRAAAFQIGDARIPIVAGAICFDMLNGGDKNWGRFSPYRDLGFQGRGRRIRQAFPARDGGWRLRCLHRQSQRRPRLGERGDALPASRSARSPSSMPSVRPPWAMVRISGRPATRWAPNSAGSASRRKSPLT